MNNRYMRPLAILKNRRTELQVFDMPARLGRNDAAVDIYFFHESVSREHCIFEIINNRYTVTDLGSTAGTFIEGVRLEPHIPYNVEDGARIKIGKVKFVFQANYGELAARSQNGAAGSVVRSTPTESVRKAGATTISAKELTPFEYNEDEVVYIDCGIEAQDRPMSYTSRLSKRDIDEALSKSEGDAEEPGGIDDTEDDSKGFDSIDIESSAPDDVKLTQKIDLSDLEEDTGEIPADIIETSQLKEDNESDSDNRLSLHLMWIDDETGETKNLIINRFPFYLGRKSTENDYTIAKKGFSRKHMHFEESNGNYFVCDDGSTNGTKINGNLIESGINTKIQSGDRMRIAGITFFIEIK